MRENRPVDFDEVAKRRAEILRQRFMRLSQDPQAPEAMVVLSYVDQLMDAFDLMSELMERNDRRWHEHLCETEARLQAWRSGRFGHRS